jgi:hypothetical protein
MGGRQRSAGGVGGVQEPVGERPVAVPAPEPAPELPAEERVHVEEIVGGSRLDTIRPQQPTEGRQVVLGLVDRVFRVVGRGPTDPCLGDGIRPVRERIHQRQLAFGRAYRLQRVEGRHPGARSSEVHAGVREHHTLRRRPDGEAEEKLLARDAVGRGGESEAPPGSGFRTPIALRTRFRPG